jgi:hypothetical protein
MLVVEESMPDRGAHETSTCDSGRVMITWNLTGLPCVDAL